MNSSEYSSDSEGYNVVGNAKELIRNGLFYFKSTLLLDQNFLDQFFKRINYFDDTMFQNYQIKKDDTLGKISENFLGFEDYKYYIYLENKDVIGQCANCLKEGVIIKIPKKNKPTFIYKWWLRLIKKYVIVEFINIIIRCETNGFIKNLYRKDEKSYGFGHFQEMVIKDILNHPIYKYMFYGRNVEHIKNVITDPKSINFVYYNICLILCQIDTAFYYLCKHNFFTLSDKDKIFFICAFHHSPKKAVDYIKEKKNKDDYKTNCKEMFVFKGRYRRTKNLIKGYARLQNYRIEIIGNVNYNLNL